MIIRKALILATTLVGVSAAAGAAHAELKVVTTVPDLAALARAVGGDHVEAKSLSLRTQDPHFVDPKPSLVLDVNKADMLIAVGAELEIGWLSTIQEGARNRKIQLGGRGFVNCARHVELMDVPDERVDRSQGDVHPRGNPHYLYDPRRAIQCARGIARMMMELDSEHAADYEANFVAFEKELQKRIRHWEAHMERHRGAAILTYHRSWIYLADWLGLDIVERLEPKPGVPPSTRHVIRVIKLARKKNARLILQESYYPNKTGRLVAEKIDVDLVELPSGTDVRAGESYIDHMDAVVARLDEALDE